MCLVYSNHGEVFDYYRYLLPYRNDGTNMVRGTTHGPYPYEILYANMQMWLIPGYKPTIVNGIARSIDITPTLLHLAKIDHEPLDGESMLEYFSNGS